MIWRNTPFTTSCFPPLTTWAGRLPALNTLSTLLFIPVYNDFDITGAPWIKGVKRGESCRVLKFSRKQWGDDRKRIIYAN